MNPYAVAVSRDDKASYPGRPPFHPPPGCPELAVFGDTSEENRVHPALRSMFRMLGYDADRYGTPQWNPLGWLVHPGDRVFLKPNMITHAGDKNGTWDHVVTNGSVIRAVMDYVYLALQGSGSIIIGDGPQSDSQMDLIRKNLGLDAIQSFYRERLNFGVELVDLRDEQYVDRDGIYIGTVKLPGDPRGKTIVNLGSLSMFSQLDPLRKKYYGAYYDWKETNRHHSGGRHEYKISRTPLEADVFINLPKLKTHKKCGLTVNVKSMVGINADKNWLPHYALGSPAGGGDQFDTSTWKNRLENAIVLPSKAMLIRNVPFFKELARKTKEVGYDIFGATDMVVRSGNWHGNDTVWRMSVDLHRILMYANPDGSLRLSGPAKRYFSVVDGIVAMEGNGPVSGARKDAGVLVAGSNPVAVDAVCLNIMGFDYHKVPIVGRAFDNHALPLITVGHDQIQVLSNQSAWNRPLSEWEWTSMLHFQPHFAWSGAVEIEQNNGTAKG